MDGVLVILELTFFLYLSRLRLISENSVTKAVCVTLAWYVHMCVVGHGRHYLGRGCGVGPLPTART